MSCRTLCAAATRQRASWPPPLLAEPAGEHCLVGGRLTDRREYPRLTGAAATHDPLRAVDGAPELRRYGAPQWQPTRRGDYERIDQITIEDVERYRVSKVRDGQLGATSINNTLMTLAAILESALDYELIARNPARGRRRRLPA